MKKTTSIALLALVLPLAGRDAEIQDDAPPVVVCAKCENTGLLPCPAHDKKGDGCDLERRVLYCSEIAGCASCSGAGWFDCDECENPEAEAWLQAKLASLEDRAEDLARFEKLVEHPVRVAESEHFVLVCELKPMKLGRTKANEHQLMHAYIDRLEALFVDYCEVLGVKEDQFGKKSEVYLWSDPDDHEKAANEYCGFFWEDAGVYQRGAGARYSVQALSKQIKDDAALHQNLVHHVVHGLMNMQKPSQWTGDMPGGWADAGLAHWFEERHFGTCDVYCYPGTEPPNFKPTKWRLGVRKLFTGGGVPDLEAMSLLRNREMTGEQHALGFALIDYFMVRDAKKLDMLLKRLRGRTPFRDAVKEIYGEKLPDLQEAWREWVISTYPKR